MNNDLSKKFIGTGVAMVTPFLDNGNIDTESFKKLIEFWINAGVDYLVALGTTGESATIHGEDKQKVLTLVKDLVDGRLPLMAGVGGNDTNKVLEEFKRLNFAGYDAILSVSPYYSKPNQDGIFQHYKVLGEASALPIIMYNVPSRTGQNITADTQLKIARECKNIIGTKEASGNFEQITKILKDKPRGFLVISGDDGVTLPMIAMGASGVISVVANAYPKEFSNMVNYCIAGKYKEALSIHFKMADVITTLFEEGSPSGVKAYLSEMGLCKNAFRLPVWQVSDGLHQRIKGLMQQFD